jgi:cob(I)alamin adenosyltransferase
MKLYTKKGDDGGTELFGGPRVSKCDPRVAAYGEVDETNAAVGVALAGCSDSSIAEKLLSIQIDLFVVGAELATPEGKRPPQTVTQQDISRLESWIDDSCAAVNPLRNFVLPGGHATAAAMHLARAVCRRAERAVVLLSRQQAVNSLVIVYLNRLSDLFFALARLANHRAGVADIPWIPPKPPAAP